MGRVFTCNPYSDDRATYKLISDGVDKDSVLETKVGDAYLKLKPAGLYECRYEAWLYWGSQVKSRYGNTAYTKNCTDQGHILVKDAWAGSVGGKTVCTTCCSSYVGIRVASAGKVKGKTGVLSDRVSVGGCTASLSEAAYCGWTAWPHECLDYFDKGKTNSRNVVIPCMDVYMRFLTSCKVFSASIASFVKVSFPARRFEPEGFRAKLSSSQVMLIEAAAGFPDRVCNPYSYYYPDTAVKSVAHLTLSMMSTLLVVFFKF